MKKPLAAALLALAVLASAPVDAGGDKVAFPENFASGALYATVDRADNKQFRELYTSPAALAAIKAGLPAPSGTVVVMVAYKAKLDAQGNPEKGADGHFIKDGVVAYNVMEKRAGWGTEYPDTLRNGEWEYQSFTPAKTVNAAAKLDACFTCHKPLDKTDFLFSYDSMKAAK